PGSRSGQRDPGLLATHRLFIRTVWHFAAGLYPSANQKIREGRRTKFLNDSYIKKESETNMNTNLLLHYGSRLRVIRVLLAMSLACCFLAAFRVYWTQNFSYIWLV